MKLKLIILLTFISIFSFGQNKHLSIGLKGNGLCFGNSNAYNGIRLNLIDKNVNKLNGLNIALISHSKKSNGLKFAFHSVSTKTNGLNFAIWGVDDYESNGLTIAFGAGASKFNGIGIAALGISGDTLNGIFFSIIGTSNWTPNHIDKVTGISIGVILGVQTKELNGLAIGINNYAEKQNGVTIGLINKSKELHGFQFGLWNIADNNKVFKGMPFINFNLRKANP